MLFKDFFENKIKNILSRSKENSQEKNEEDDENLEDYAYPENDGRRWIKFVEKEFHSVIEQYHNNLGLNDQALANKEKILDIGAGDADFAAYCKKNHINDNVFSLDFQRQDHPGIIEAQKMHLGEEIYNYVKNHSVTGKMEEMPFENESFDLIVDHSAIPGIYYQSNEIVEMKEGIKDSFNEMVRVLKRGGEARLFPIGNYGDGKDNMKGKILDQVIDQKLTEPKNSGACQISIEDVFDSKTKKIDKGKRVVIKKI